jgi:hypothetical protein
VDEQDPPGEKRETSDDLDRATNHGTNHDASGDATRDGAPDAVPGDDHGFLAEEFDDSGYVPEEWEIEGPAVSISLGDAADLDPALLAAMTGPDGLGGNALCQAYEQDAAADVLRPGPVLAALTEQAARDVGRLTDDQLMGALSAARRLENRAAYLQAVTIAEFARRRTAQAEEASARDPRRGRRSADFPDEELAMELLTSQLDAGARIDAAACLTARLPATLAGLGAGSIDHARASIILFYTGSLSAADAARADEILAAAAPGLRPDQLARKAAALEMKLDPQAARDRKDRAAKHDRRVEVRREASGNASLSGRELSVADAMASKSHLDAIAARLRAAGVAGTLDHLRALALTELTQGRDPLSRLTPAPADPAAGDPPDPDADPDPGAPDFGSPDDDASAPAPVAPESAAEPHPPTPAPDATAPGSHGTGQSSHSPPSAPATRATAPFPATINLLVPAGTLLGWSAAPGWAGGWGLLDPDDTRDIVKAASQHPATRWCLTYTGPDGTAMAHACAHGQHPWAPPDHPNNTDHLHHPHHPRHPDRPDHGYPPSPPDPPRPPYPPGDGPPRDPGHHPPDESPDAAQAAQLADLLRALNAIPKPIARGSCDHRNAEDRYTPSRTLKHLIRARTATCSAPGCGAQAVYCDLDHVVPYPDGPSCECNLHPACRRHHRCKQAPGWDVQETQPGVMRWTTPAGRAHTTTPTAYDV